MRLWTFTLICPFSKQPAKITMVKLAMELGIFDALAKEQEIDLITLASTSGADPNLICKIL